MSAIFLSYRRGDAQGTTGRIFDWLEKHYGPDEVFMDVEDIPLGVDFRKHIQAHVERAEVLLAIIGPQWNGKGATGRARLSSKKDWVRIEIQLAREARVALIPLFVDGASSATLGRLPKALEDLAYHQAEHIDSGRNFASHIQRLVKQLDKLIARRRAERRQHSKTGLAAALPFVTSPSRPTTSAASPATPRTVIAKPAKPVSHAKSAPCVITVAEDLANELAAIAKGKG